MRILWTFALLVLLIVTHQVLSPVFGTPTIQEHRVRASPAMLEVRFPISMGPVFPRTFLVSGMNCINGIRINDHRIASDIFPLCNSSMGLELPTHFFMQKEANIVSVMINALLDNQTGIDVRISPWDPLECSFNILYCILLSMLGYLCIRRWNRGSQSQSLAFVFLGGSMLRVWYFLTTGAFVRFHDVTGHVEYIRHVARYLRLPPSGGGWEFHQSPLYYIVSGLWWRMGEWIARSPAEMLRDLQVGSLLLSIAAFAIGLPMAAILFSRQDAHRDATKFLLLLATIPSLVFLSAWINNDVPATFFAFLIILLLLRWWRSPDMTAWIMLWIIIAVGVLVKETLLPFIIIALLCLLSHTHISRKRKLSLCAIGISILFLLTFWLVVLRNLEPDHGRLLSMGNGFLNDDLRVGNSITDYLIFHPGRIFQLPFNTPWLDIGRRQLFWEFFFRSVLFGEFQFTRLWMLCAHLALAGMILLLALLYGITADCRLRSRYFFPLIVTTIVLLATLIIYRIAFPFSPNQDFRFVTGLALPFSYYIVIGIRSAPAWFQEIANVALGAFVLLSAIFLILAPLLNITP